MKAAILAVSALIGITACNRETKRDADNSDASAKAAEEARQTNRDVKEGTGAAVDSIRGENKEDRESMSGKARDESRQAGRDVKEGAGKATDKTKEEARQAGRDVKEGAKDVGSKIKEEARQASRDVGETLGGDRGVTEADKKTLTRIRSALRKDKETAKEADDVKITVDNGKVNLRGTVTTAEVKKDMARVASDIAGSTKVVDDVKVAERVGAGTND
jgi:osmotically-inducible protein OsmY